MVWIAFALMTAGAVLCVAWPLARTRGAARDAPADVAFYRQQLAELDEDVSRGLLGEADVASTRAELGRRLLVAADATEAPRRPGRGRHLAAVAVLVLVPALALGLYLKIGRPAYEDDPLALRATPTRDIAAMLQRVEAHLASAPDDARGYELIAPIYMQMRRYDDAAHAFGEVLRISGDTPERQAAYGQALVMAADGVVTQQARGAFEAALKANPPLPQALFFVGLAAEQDGDKVRARDIWTKLAAEAPPGASWVEIVRRRLAALDGPPDPAAGVPSGPAAAGIAALPADQRDAAIRGMVEGLAARLAKDGGDAEGWLRLVRAYKVLGETDKARQALGDARRSMSGDAGTLSRLDGLAQELGLGG